MMLVIFLSALAGWLLGFGVCAWVTWRTLDELDKEALR